jgi:hypothetical protein
MTTAGTCSPFWRRGVQLGLSVANATAAGWRKCFENPYLTPLGPPDKWPGIITEKCDINSLLLFAAMKNNSPQASMLERASSPRAKKRSGITGRGMVRIARAGSAEWTTLRRALFQSRGSF